MKDAPYKFPLKPEDDIEVLFGAGKIVGNRVVWKRRRSSASRGAKKIEAVAVNQLAKSVAAANTLIKRGVLEVRGKKLRFVKRRK
jgi:hypothetical protein